MNNLEQQIVNVMEHRKELVIVVRLEFGQLVFVPSSIIAIDPFTVAFVELAVEPLVIVTFIVVVELGIVIIVVALVLVGRLLHQ